MGPVGRKGIPDREAHHITQFLLVGLFSNANERTNAFPLADTDDKLYLRRAGLPSVGWHRLRHSFGTLAALFGVKHSGA